MGCRCKVIGGKILKVLVVKKRKEKKTTTVLLRSDCSEARIM